MRKVRVGMIGHSFPGRVHSQAYRDLLAHSRIGIEPVMQTIVGRRENEVKLAAEELGWLSYETDWRRLIERDDIDIIDIGTPVSLHREIAVAAAEAGKHIICSSPLAGSKAEAEKIWRSARKAGVVHMVPYPLRYMPAVRYARKIVNDGLLGDIYHFRAQCCPKSNDRLGTSSKRELLEDLLAHSIDLGRNLIGEIQEAVGMKDSTECPVGSMNGTTTSPHEEKISPPNENSSCESMNTALTALVRFDNGIIGIFEVSQLGKGFHRSNLIEINGNKGSLRLDLEELNTVRLCLQDPVTGKGEFRNIDCSDYEAPGDELRKLAGKKSGYEQAFVYLMHEFMRGIHENACPSPNFEDGYKNRVLLDAIKRSAKTRTWLKIG
ncbi:Gfo/Idh/MocA family protein [Cohnella terricola]|uniref:Gfo/Idh/MocA family oxidoreductase n=1 Tax=Cohnella terricola TaxID=1289167 RepID=A0A559JC00_9BACL|nr:Gfo/Idh/MocA family oxidoreductase [Cohnella terricola]TVX97399.1 Gfo/Idh/MocA family oxidoreductase [Cohnella terricola]